MEGEGLTQAQWERVREKCRSDPWHFAQLVIPEDRGVERFHRPLLDLFTRRGRAFLDKWRKPEYQSALVDSVRAWCRRWGYDPDTDRAERHLEHIITNSGVNARISRSTGKTTYADVGTAWLADGNPNEDIGIASKSSPATEKILEGVANIFLSEPYRTFFPERIPPGTPRDFFNKQRSILAGRTKLSQATVEGRGLLGNWTGPHYGVIRGDDIVGTQSGEASMADALTWIAALGGISKSRIIGGTWRMFQGTVYDELDDNSVHMKDPTILTVIVPIWTKPEYSLDRLMEDGVPTLPEWYSVADIREMRAKILANTAEGPVSWLNNFELTTLSAGDRRMPMETLRRQTLVIEEGENGQECLVRPGADGKPVRFFVNQLDRSAGLDQAVTETRKSDLWVFAHAGQDQFGHRYLLDGIAGKGYENMLANVMPAWLNWGRPSEVGIDTTGTQIVTTDLMKREAAFQQIIPCLRPVSSANVSKVIRIMTYIVAGLKSGVLWIHPKLKAFIEQAYRWNPDSARANMAGTDDWLDAAAIALEVLHSIPISPEDIARSEFRAYSAREKTERSGFVEQVVGEEDWFSVLFDGDGFDE